MVLRFHSIFETGICWCRRWVMVGTRAFGTGRWSIQTRRGCRWLHFYVRVTARSLALQTNSPPRDPRPYTGVSHTTSTTRNFGAGTWTRSIAWSSSRASLQPACRHQLNHCLLWSPPSIEFCLPLWLFFSVHSPLLHDSIFANSLLLWSNCIPVKY